jgi:hypothetical protein
MTRKGDLTVGTVITAVAVIFVAGLLIWVTVKSSGIINEKLADKLCSLDTWMESL